MELIKNHWTAGDIAEFNKYLLTFSKGAEKGDWERRIVNTTLPCIAVPSVQVGVIVREIAKGNYMEFIDLWPWENFTDTTVVGGLICRIKDIDVQLKYLLHYSRLADNWATIDTIKIKPKKADISRYMDFAKSILHSPHTFTRRLGVILMLKLVSADTIDDILSSIAVFADEGEYYVNMAVAWLLAECFTKCRGETLDFIRKHNDDINDFVMNKTISKCRDSYRVSVEDKEMLVRYKRR